MSGIATAIAVTSIGASLLSSSAQKGAAREATESQERSTQLEIAESRRQFDKLQEVLSPFVGAGAGAIGAQATLAGLGGPEEEAAAIEAIRAGPEFGALVRTGEEAILQNQAAIGGLRGGNIRGQLAQFRPQILSQLINQRFGRLGGIAQLGQASAAGVGVGAIRTGESIGGAFRNVGEARAGGALARGRTQANLFGDIGGAFGALIGSDLFGGANIGGGTGDPLGGLTIPGPGDITGGVF